MSVCGITSLVPDAGNDTTSRYITKPIIKTAKALLEVKKSIWNAWSFFVRFAIKKNIKNEQFKHKSESDESAWSISVEFKREKGNKAVRGYSG